jgi:membrane dipeptidase
VSDEVPAPHRAVLALDSHIDIPWPDGPAFAEEGTRRADLPKLKRGGIGAACFAAYVPQAKRTPENEQAAYERAIGMLQRIRAMGETPGARLATSAAEIEAAWRDGVVAIVPAVENGFAAGRDLSRLAEFRRLGARYLTLTHNGHNALADSANPRKDLEDVEAEHGGLSPLGREAVAELNRLGMLVDISHVSRAAMLEAASLSATPVVATHSCIRALCDHPRNLDDAQLDAIRDTGGVVQVTAVAGFLKRGAKPDQVTVADFCDHIDHAVRRIGLAHVGISSDFDGGGWFQGWKDASESGNLTAELVRRGYGTAEIAALWGGNFLRVLRAAG